MRYGSETLEDSLPNQAKVSNLGLQLCVQQDVFWLDVSMNWNKSSDYLNLTEDPSRSKLFFANANPTISLPRENIQECKNKFELNTLFLVFCLFLNKKEKAYCKWIVFYYKYRYRTEPF